jgi:hypothetical protein
MIAIKFQKMMLHCKKLYWKKIQEVKKILQISLKKLGRQFSGPLNLNSKFHVDFQIILKWIWKCAKWRKIVQNLWVT